MSKPEPLNVAVIYGSARSERNGIKAARFIVRRIEKRGHHAPLIDSEQYPLPMLDRMHKEYAPGTAPEAMQAVADLLVAADGFIIVSGEYNHSIPAALKNLLDHFQQEYFYKPSGIVTYSAGPFGGVRALINLRAVLAELGTPSIPSALPISQVGAAFDDDGVPADTAYDTRSDRFLDEFEWYARALKLARAARALGVALPTQQELCRGR